mgnify:CR=1 FL=1
MENKYVVTWERSALRRLGQLYNINQALVYKNSKSLLSSKPYGLSYGSADYPNFQFNGYHWSCINNAIVVYRISEQESTVFVDASCEYGMGA